MDYKPDNLCKAYLAIIESLQNQLGERDIINETHDFVDLNKIVIEILMQAFSFFSGMTQDEKNLIMKAYKNGEFDDIKARIPDSKKKKETTDTRCFFLFFSA